MKFSEMPYVRPDVEKVKAELNACAEKIRTADSVEAQIAAFDEASELSKDLMTTGSIAYVRNTINTKDPFYKAERAFWDQAEPLMSEKLQVFNEHLLASPFRPQLEQALGSLYFKHVELSLKGFSPEIIPLLQEENELTSAYQELYASARV